MIGPIFCDKIVWYAAVCVVVTLNVDILTLLMSLAPFDEIRHCVCIEDYCKCAEQSNIAMINNYLILAEIMRTT